MAFFLPSSLLSFLPSLLASYLPLLPSRFTSFLPSLLPSFLGFLPFFFPSCSASSLPLLPSLASFLPISLRVLFFISFCYLNLFFHNLFVKVPDVSPCSMLASCPYYDLPQLNPEDEGFYPRFSMCSGDFVEIYGSIPAQMNPINGKNCLDCNDINLDMNMNNKGENEEEWDAVVTCFFVDTAPVVLGNNNKYYIIMFLYYLCIIILYYISFKMLYYIISCFIILYHIITILSHFPFCSIIPYYHYLIIIIYYYYRYYY